MNFKIWLAAMAGLLPLGASCAATDATSDLRLPPGFHIEVWADQVPNARTLVRGDKGTVFVSSMREGKVYALQDTDGDGRPDKTHVLAKELRSPNGIAFRDGALYVAEIQRIVKYPGIESSLANPPQPVTVRDDLPTEGHHGWRYIAFGPDGKLYVAIGAPCNVCKVDSFVRDGNTLEYASITRMDPDGSNWELVARGVRNSVGFTWHPQTGQLWFTENGRDMLGDDLPSCELNKLSKVGEHFGFPYCHAGDIADPDFGKDRKCGEFTAPVEKLGAHVAPLGIRFYTGSMFPPEYRNQPLIAEHGSWNRSEKSGYKVERVKLDASGNGLGQTPFIEGWLKNEEVSGRPADLLVMPDGALLVSDDLGGRIYRISYR